MNVYQLAIQRIKFIFSEFDNVLLAFSGGKDSGVCVNLFYDYAKDNDLLHKLAIYHEDYEAGYPQTFEYVERVFDSMPDIKRYWLCLPISAANSASMYQNKWIPWDDLERDKWVRSMPKKDYVYHIDNIFFPFKKGTSGFDTRIIFADEFAKKYGKTAVIVGLRMDESLSRRAIITSKRRVNTYLGKKYSKVNENTVNFYPIYDWTTKDIWVANYKFAWDYNKLYDLYYMAGLDISGMRTASPFHASGQKSLKLYRAICPDMWGKMVSRVNGVNFAGLYGGTTAMGWMSITKPNHFTWKEYAEFLISTLPEKTRNKFITSLQRFKSVWSEVGYGRNPRVIEAIKQSGTEIVNTKQISKRCTKPDIYEVIKIVGEWPDEIDIEGATPFRHCPNWKAVCVTIMKNDFTLQYMGLGRTKSQNERRKAILDKYNELL